VLVAALTALGLATRTRFVDRTRAVRRRAHDIGCWLRRRNDDARVEVQALNLELVDIATKTIAEARRVAVNARRGVRDCETKATGKALRAIRELERCAGLVEQITASVGTEGAMLWLTDRKGRRVGIPTGKLAYVEIGAPRSGRSVGFSAPVTTLTP